MGYLIAKTPKALDIALRLLYAEKVGYGVSVCETPKGKIFYRVHIIAEEAIARDLQEKFRILTS